MVGSARVRFLPILVVLGTVVLGIPRSMGAVEPSVHLGGTLGGTMATMYNQGDATQDILGAWSAVATVQGNLRIQGGSREVKAEVLLGLDTFPEQKVDLQRAWVRFKAHGILDGLRVTTGLTRLDWGPALVLNPGNLLFLVKDGSQASLGGGANQGEVYSESGLILDLWYGLGGESFVQGALRIPKPIAVQGLGNLVVPSPVEDLAGAIRASTTVFGVTLEASGLVDGGEELLAGALSFQGNALVDWYGTLRFDLPLDLVVSEPLHGVLGFFGLGNLGEYLSVSTRNEVSFDPQGIQSYHGLTLGIFDEVQLGLTGLVDWNSGEWVALGDLSQAYLHGLQIGVRMTARFYLQELQGGPGALGLGAYLETKF